MNLHNVSVETSQPVHANVQRPQTAGHLLDLRRAQTAGRLFEGHTGPNVHTGGWGTEKFAPPTVLPRGPASPPQRRPAVSALHRVWRRPTVHALRTSRRAGWDVSTEPVVVVSASEGL